MSQSSVDAAVYYDAAGVGGGTYTELTIVENVTGNDSRTELPIKLRGRSHTLYEVGMIDSAVDFTILYEPSNAGYQALRDAYDSGGDIGLAFLDTDIGTAAAGEGWEGDYKISSFTKPQEVDTIWMCTCKAVPSAEPDAVAPRDYTPSGV